MRPSRRFALALVVAALLPSVIAAQTKPAFQVIVHPSNPASSLTRDELSDLFLKRTTRWKSGQTVAPADLSEDAPTRAEFSKEIHRKVVRAVKAYWQQRIFSGREAPPPEFAGDSSMINFVRTHAGSIGYVSPGADLAGVKLIAVIE